MAEWAHGGVLGARLRDGKASTTDRVRVRIDAAGEMVERDFLVRMVPIVYDQIISQSAHQRSQLHVAVFSATMPTGVLEAAPLAQQLHLWVKQLSYFLMHFPGDSDYDGGGIEPLRRLERSLCIRNHGQK